MSTKKEQVENSYENDRLTIERQLGRPPVGFEEVVKRTRDGVPAVIRVASMVDGVPFPTLYWLCEPNLNQLVHRYESAGATQRIQESIDQCEEYQDRLIRDNQLHVTQRASFFDPKVRSQLDQLGIAESFEKKGIGGNSNFRRVRCLHAYLAAHLVTANLVGQLLVSIYGSDDPLVIALSRLN